MRGLIVRCWYGVNDLPWSFILFFSFFTRMPFVVAFVQKYICNVYAIIKLLNAILFQYTVGCERDPSVFLCLAISWTVSVTVWTLKRLSQNIESYSITVVILR